jgi:hypothetical protein
MRQMLIWVGYLAIFGYAAYVLWVYSGLVSLP